tara:strand:+ start:171 stop:362 length:192 start_codon:yes stop_codon:yes gene_type:complete
MSVHSAFYRKWIESLICALCSDATLDERLISKITKNCRILVLALVSKFMANPAELGGDTSKKP